MNMRNPLIDNLYWCILNLICMIGVLFNYRNYKAFIFLGCQVFCIVMQQIMIRRNKKNKFLEVTKEIEEY